MPHSPEEKKKVLARVRRIRGQCDALDRALEQCGVEHKMVVYGRAPHGSGTGTGTDAAGWLYDAVDFWEEVTAQQ